MYQTTLLILKTIGLNTAGILATLLILKTIGLNTAGILATLLSEALFLSVQANPTDLLVNQTQVDVPVCYMQTPEGKQVNLTRLCGTTSRQNTAQSCATEVNAKAVPIMDVNYTRNILTGQVQNKTCEILKYIKVNYEVLDEAGNTIDNGYIYAEPLMLKPGEVASFRGIVTSGATVQTTHLDWLD